MSKRLFRILFLLLFVAGGTMVWAQKKSSSKKPVKKTTTTKKAPVKKGTSYKKGSSKKPVAKRKTNSGLTASLPVLKDSVLEKDVPVKKFDSIILNARKLQHSIKSEDFNLGKTFGAAVETLMPLQFKYAILLNESVEKLSNIVLYQNIDSWYGTRYRYGGTTAKGIDCSAFMQVISSYSYERSLPRTAREQYLAMEGIRKEDLQEGDYVFFNTTGGISHVGMYLTNNKFIHSSSSQGVSIGDLNSKYWSKRFIGARRAVEKSEELPAPPIVEPTN
ncbi:MAG TPA: C40 family peptidase [Phnomibacter sp.]|nr:C40 family peptidase [Phnomibacter sp.]